MLLTEEQAQFLEDYNKGLQFYKQRKWQDAMDAFKLSLETMPEDKPSQIYLSRCKHYLKNPPAEDWDGVFNLQTK